MHGRGLSKVHKKSWLNDFISRVKTMQLGVDAHPHPYYKDWLVVSLINQVGSTRASFLFSVSFLIAGLLLMVGGAAGR